MNRLTSITNNIGQTTTFTYDALGRRTSMTHANGVMTTYQYDAASQLLSLVHQLGATTINSFDYTYDKVGNRTTKVDNNGPANYTYDTLNRLVQATNPLPTNPLETFNYDEVGNRTDSNQNGLSVFNTANQLTEDAQFTYQYDANGNQTQKTDKVTGDFTTYEYDAENKLIRVVSSSGTTANYKYDGLGRRVEKEVTEAGLTNITRFIYDNEDILLELDGSNQIVARYTHGPGIDEPLVMERGGASFFYHADGLNSITEITDSVGSVAQSYSYSSFGKIEFQLNSNFIQPYTFTSREFDTETGLYFYRARTYDSFTGRFLREDPLRFHAGINFYLMVGNNPINHVDPLGLFNIDFIAGFHVPISPGVAIGPVISSSAVGYSEDPFRPLTANPLTWEVALGVIADIGVAAGFSDLSNTGGACASDVSINFGLGRFAGLQIVPRVTQDTTRWFFDPLRYIDGISFGLGVGVALPISLSAPIGELGPATAN